MNIEIYFDGYCPESLLKGDYVEMKLNSHDFWESEETGLQMTVFPPYATILKWRGKGNFRTSSPKGSDILAGLVFTEPLHDEPGIFPDEQKIIHNEEELKLYISGIQG